MVELFLNRLQVIKDVRVVELKVVEDQRPRAVVNKLGRLSKKAQSYSSASMTKNGLSPARGDVEIARNAANHEPRLIAAGFKDPVAMPAVVVLPWVPATASTQRSRSTKSCSHCGPDI